jgi:NAD(P)-dependent dehydrogenase (short-subunit alcohol dehydrogenase family)
MATRWSADDVPDLRGCHAIVTGANSGIGFEAARALARRGARVVLACRRPEQARAAAEAIAREAGAGSAEPSPLDLADLGSVRAFAAGIAAKGAPLHLLVNNAGVMAIPQRRTADGFEMQLGTNHLGHFALTGLLLERLLATPGSRIVSVSSSVHRVGRIDFDDLQGERGYGAWRAYAQSKLANLLFAFELQRRLARRSASPISVACHPGYAATQLQFAGPRLSGSSVMEWIMRFGNRLFAQSAAMGALPTLYAATAPDVVGGDYIGPGGLAEMTGPPRKVGASARARDAAAAARLWESSERLTGVRFEALE